MNRTTHPTKPHLWPTQRNARRAMHGSQAVEVDRAPTENQTHQESISAPTDDRPDSTDRMCKEPATDTVESVAAFVDDQQAVHKTSCDGALDNDPDRIVSNRSERSDPP